MKLDFKKVNRVAELSREADCCIRIQDYGQAREIAGEIALLGWPVISADIYMRTGEVEKARELVVPVAEELSGRGYHMRAAAHYHKVGMTEEFLLELEQHRLIYGINHGKKLMS